MSTTDRPLPLLPTRMSSERKPADSQHEPSGAFVVYLILCILAIFSWVSIGINASGSFEINPLTLGFSDRGTAVDPISMSLDAAKISLCGTLGWLAVKRVRSAFNAATTAFLLLFILDLIAHIYVLTGTNKSWRSDLGWPIVLSVVYVLFRMYALVVLFLYASVMEGNVISAGFGLCMT